MHVYIYPHSHRHLCPHVPSMLHVASLGRLLTYTATSPTGAPGTGPYNHSTTKFMMSDDVCVYYHQRHMDMI